MCEVFGAYGWAEGAPMMKFIIDHMLVRGINVFVPHAFTSVFPDSDCPPHFGAAEGASDPQFKAFSELMGYTNKISHILSGGTHACSAAILYHAEAEWINRYDEAMLTEVPAKILYDSHIDYDILPSDVFVGDGNSAIPLFTLERKGAFGVNGREYTCLVIPEAELLAPGMEEKLDILCKNGVTVLRMGKNADTGSLAELVRAATPADVLIEKTAGTIPDLYVRHCHYTDKSADIYMFVNESASDEIEFCATLASAREKSGTLYDFASKEGFAVTLSEKNTITLRLEKYQSFILVLDGDTPPLPKYEIFSPAGELKCNFKIETAPYTDMERFTVFSENVSSEKLPNITGAEGSPEFSGVIRYTAEIGDIKGKRLYLSEVGETAEVFLNGKSLGVRFAPPYVFDISDAVREGKNTLKIEVSNTLAHALRDNFSRFIALPRSGLFGPILIE